MKIKIQTTLNCSPDAAWREVKKVSLLQYVARPLVAFSPVYPTAFPEYWPEHETVIVNFKIFNLIPFGRHSLDMEKIDDKERKLQTREKSHVLKKWDHLIHITSKDGKTVYTDEVEFDAGILTPVVWIFANIFYRHRQRRWNKLAPSL